MAEALIGRAAEIGLLHRLVAGGGALVLAGEPGVGRTALLDAAAAAAAAAGARVVRVQGVPAEAGLDHAGLHQLVDPLAGALTRLDDLHWAAFAAALGPAAGPPVDRLVLGQAVLALLRCAAGAAPLLLVVDDLDQLDPPSADVLGFAARRLAGNPAATGSPGGTGATGSPGNPAATGSPGGTGASPGGTAGYARASTDAAGTDAAAAAGPGSRAGAAADHAGIPAGPGGRIGFLAAVRTAAGRPAAPAGVPHHELCPLPPAAAAELLQAAAPALAPQVRPRILAAAAGNPLALRELPGPLTPQQRAGALPLPPVLPLNDRLRAAFGAGQAELPAPTREMLLLAALDGTGDLGVLHAVAGDRGLAALAPAEHRGLVRIQAGTHRLAFRHPLTRSAVAALATAAERQRAHRLLAAALTGEPERRAQHLAEATAGPDEAVAGLLDRAAGRLLRGGDSPGALTALRRAAELSPTAAARARRLTEAAYLSARTDGPAGTATHLLAAARAAGLVAAAPADSTSADGGPADGRPVHPTPAYGTPADATPANGTPADGRPADSTSADGGPADGRPVHPTPAYGTPADATPANGAPAGGAPVGGAPAGTALLAAAAEALLLGAGAGDLDSAHRLLVAAIGAHGGDAAGGALRSALAALARICAAAGQADRWQPFEAALARLSPPAAPDLRLLAAAADPARATSDLLDLLDRSIAELPVAADPGWVATVGAAAGPLDRLAGCRAQLRGVVAAERAGGAPVPATACLALLWVDEFASGRWDGARARLADGLALCERTGSAVDAWTFRYYQALLAAACGDEPTVQAATAGMLRWALSHGAHGLYAGARHARALAALGRNDPDEAYRQAAAISPPGVLAPYTPTALWVCLDLVEAAVRTNRAAEATAHVAALQAAGIAALSPRLALVTGAAAALAAQRPAAAAEFERALAVPGAERWPFDLARVRLAYGGWLRRGYAVAAARGHLDAAVETFEQLGALPWAARAHAELRASGRPIGRPVAAVAGDPGRAGPAGPLTAQEQEIAALAAAGLTNKQIGARLFLSHRTVGSHLYRIFPKLGITARAALRDALAGPPPPAPSGTAPSGTAPSGTAPTGAVPGRPTPAVAVRATRAGATTGRSQFAR